VPGMLTGWMIALALASADGGMETVRTHAQPSLPAADAWLGPDKAQHFWASYGVTVFAFSGASAAGVEHRAALGIAAGSALVAGIAKEAHDRHRGRGFSMRDLIADALGIGAAYFLLREVR
jgi:uncharacterized protein YfiM (DUF2279 family)